MEAMVFPNPSFMVLITVFAGSVVNARKSDTRKRAIKAFSFSLDVRIIIAIMLIPTRIDAINGFIGKIQVLRM